MKKKIISLIILLFMSVSALSVGTILSVNKGNLAEEKQSNQIESTALASETPEIEELEVIGDANYVRFKKLFGSATSESQQYSGLSSYLEITFDALSGSGATNFKINRARGTLTFNVAKDEIGNTIKTSTSGTYYFTCEGTYIVSYKIGETSYSSQCYFSPEINLPVLQGTGSRQELKKIQYIDDKYYMIGDGLSTISQKICYNSDLYNIHINNRTEMVEGVEVNKYETPSETNIYVLTIPANSYGTLTLTFDSKNGYVKRTIEIVVVNPAYEKSFILYDENGKPTTKDFNDYKFGTDTKTQSDYYVFNSKATLNLSPSRNLVDTNGARYYQLVQAGTEPTDEELQLAENNLNKVRTECVKLLNLYSTETERNSSNTSSSVHSRILIDTPNGPTWSKDFEPKDHSMFEVSTALSFSEKTSLNESIVNFKIITKVPTTDSKYDFAVYLTGSNTTDEALNYINTCLYGYLFDGATIHTQNANTIVRSTSGKKYNYFVNGTEDTMISDIINVIKDTATGINDYNIRIRTTNQTLTNDTAFEEFYCFNFTVKYYNNYSFFYYCLTDYASILNSKAYINNPIQSPVVKPLANQTLNIGGSNATLDYDSQCIPVYMQLTYNGNVYENFYDLKSGDEVSFTEYGNYVLELYTFPTYEFCKNFVNYWTESISLSKYYTRIEFVIDGPNITVTSTDGSGNPMVVTNNMYVNGGISFEVMLREELGETFEVYKNNELYYSNNISTYDMDAHPLTIGRNNIATWKIVVLDANRNVLRSTTFMLTDTTYQGISINHHADYEDLTIYKKDNSTGGYLPLEKAICYHITDAGAYRIKVTNGEKIYFNVKDITGVTNVRSASLFITNYVNFDVVDPFFQIEFATGGPGESITEKVEMSTVNGVGIKLVEIYKDGEKIAEHNPSESGGLAGLLGSSTSFSDTGIYTFRIIDQFGNQYDVQIQKFYKANVALILLLIITAFGLVFLVYFIFRSKRGLKVK